MQPQARRSEQNVRFAPPLKDRKKHAETQTTIWMGRASGAGGSHRYDVQFGRGSAAAAESFSPDKHLSGNRERLAELPFGIRLTGSSERRGRGNRSGAYRVPSTRRFSRSSQSCNQKQRVWS